MAQLGAMHSHSFDIDPKHLGFVLARYKFVAKMFSGFGKVLEVGCGDATGAGVVANEVGEWHGYDNAFTVNTTGRNLQTHFHDALRGPLGMGPFDGIYSLDVLEHINPEDEDRFLANIKGDLAPDGLVIIGSPSLESQLYASPLSKLHHVNCKTEAELRATLSRHFKRVLMFGMNDEVLHTGFGAMCQYRMAVCT